MRKTLIVSIIYIVGLSTFSQDITLEDVDAALSYLNTDFSALCHVEESGIAKKEIALFRRDSDDKLLMVQIAPKSEKGKGYLKIGSNMWIYDPNDHQFNIISTRDSLSGSIIRLSDFKLSSLASSYEIVETSEEKLGAYNTIVLKLKATTADVDYLIKKVWIDENMLVRQIQDFSFSEQLLRITAIPKYVSVNGSFAPSFIQVVDKLEQKVAKITFKKQSFKTVADMVFTQDYLERVSQ